MSVAKSVNRHDQGGATLIEVLIAMVILAFGMLSLGGLLAYALQAPKVAGYRSAAAMAAAAHIEKMRGNLQGFLAGHYDQAITYDGSSNMPALNDCAYPGCTAQSLAVMDNAQTQRRLRAELPAGGYELQRDTLAGSTEGNIWIIWNEPSMATAWDTVDSDQCPADLPSVAVRPRCMVFRFRL